MLIFGRLLDNILTQNGHVLVEIFSLIDGSAVVMVMTVRQWLLYAEYLAHRVQTQPAKCYRKLCVCFTVAGEYLLDRHGLQVAHHDMHLSHLIFEASDLRHLGVAVLVYLSLLLFGGFGLARGGIRALFDLETHEQVA
jgi:hypothetical protein